MPTNIERTERTEDSWHYDNSEHKKVKRWIAEMHKDNYAMITKLTFLSTTNHMWLECVQTRNKADASSCKLASKADASACKLASKIHASAYKLASVILASMREWQVGRCI